MRSKPKREIKLNCEMKDYNKNVRKTEKTNTQNSSLLKGGHSTDLNIILKIVHILFECKTNY